MDRDLLHSVVIAHGDNLTKLAEAMGLAQSALSNRVNGKVEFRQAEIGYIKRRYGLTADEIDRIFFADAVSNLETSGQVTA